MADRRPPKTDFPLCKGVRIGGCVAKDKGFRFIAFRKGTVAHAHSVNTDPWNERWFGWVCVSHPKWLGYSFLHEYAHLLNPNRGHGDRFRESLRKLKKKHGAVPAWITSG